MNYIDFSFSQQTIELNFVRIQIIIIERKKTHIMIIILESYYDILLE